MKLFFILLLFNTLIHANIQLIKKENNDSNTTLLVIAGIHGNEPGSYFAASLLASHYDIHSKNLWIVPQLNQASITANKRGIHGDMNRKFLTLKKDDKDAVIIDEIKKTILLKNISLVLNLHDGHGFYRKKTQNNIFNPSAWGQTCVIDQCKLDKNLPFANLNEIATSVQNDVNKNLLEKHHLFGVKNTNTMFDDKQMQLSLTYFSIINNKPAFAIESSKNLSSLAQKIYYHLLAVESFMKVMNISFKRNFELNETSIEKLLEKKGKIKINNNIVFELSQIKKILSFIPIESNNNEFEFSNLLGKVKKEGEDYLVYIANEQITRLKPQHFKISTNCPHSIEAVVDDKKVTIKKASKFIVLNHFKIIQNNNIRVNVIGFTKKNITDESNIIIYKDSLKKRFSIDKKHTQYRVEFYNKNKFCSMLVVQFK